MSISGDLKTGRMTSPRQAWQQVKVNIAAWVGFLRRPPRAGNVRHPWHRPGHIAIWAGIALVVVALMALTLDARAIGAALASPGAVRYAFELITDFGKSGWILWPTGIVLITLAFVAGPSLGRMGAGVVAALSVRLTFVFAAVALPGLFTAILKRLIGRGRPLIENSANNPYLFDPFAWKAAYASLPSGHATTAFAAAVAIGAVWPRTRPYVWVYALLICVSRVAVTAHHPSDVIAGAMVGTLGALWVRDWFARRRLAFTVQASGKVHRQPNPSWRRIKMVAHRLGGA